MEPFLSHAAQVSIGFFVLDVEYHAAICHGLFSRDYTRFQECSSFPLSHDSKCKNEQLLDELLTSFL